MNPVPAVELEALQLTGREATGLALEGHPELGYRSLVAGLDHARDLLEDGEPWAAALVAAWEAATAEFAARWGVG